MSGRFPACRMAAMGRAMTGLARIPAGGYQHQTKRFGSPVHGLQRVINRSYAASVLGFVHEICLAINLSIEFSSKGVLNRKP
jgi:hypothetical protein